MRNDNKGANSGSSKRRAGGGEMSVDMGDGNGGGGGSISCIWFLYSHGVSSLVGRRKRNRKLQRQTRDECAQTDTGDCPWVLQFGTRIIKYARVATD